MALPPIPRNVLLTGCSTGIGWGSAHFLREAGWQVFPTARKPEDLGRLKEAGFTPIRLDVASASSVEDAVAEYLEYVAGAPGALINNAGFGQPGALEDLNREAVRYQFEVNVIGLHDLTQRLAPVFRRQGAGRIVHVSSVVGRLALPFLGAYSATKFAVEALGDALRVEMSGTGVGVSIIEPGPIHTEFRTNAVAKANEHVHAGESSFGAVYLKEFVSRRDRQKKAYDPFSKPPEAVARKMLHALSSPRPRHRYCVTLPAHAGAWMRRLLPYVVSDALLRRQVKKRSE